MKIENLTDKVKQAKEAVESLEEPLKTEAFKKILDKLLEIDIIETPKNAKDPSRKKNKGNKKKRGVRGVAGVEARKESEKKKEELAKKLNRTEFQEIHKLKTILNRSLYILKIMHEKEIKSLSPPEINYILKEVFKISPSAESISVALNRRKAQQYVNRSKEIIGRTLTYKYELMKLGEDYLEKELKKED